MMIQQALPSETVVVKFRLTGVPPKHAVKLITLDRTLTIAEVKEVIKQEYGLNPLFKVQFLFGREILTSDTVLSELELDPERDQITVMSIMSGGAN